MCDFNNYGQIKLRICEGLTYQGMFAMSDFIRCLFDSHNNVTNFQD